VAADRQRYFSAGIKNGLPFGKPFLVLGGTQAFELDH
jgi:hypothetical protein